MALDYYTVLGVQRGATPQEIKRAFRQIARECHPDVSGGDPGAEERFKTARAAYETLMDPAARAAYDRRGQRRGSAPPPGPFFDAFWRATGRREGKPSSSGQGTRSPRGGRFNVKDPGNAVTLDDLFNDFGGAEVRASARAQRPSTPAAEPQVGGDVHIDVDVPASVAASGGSITAVYHRMQRADSWRPGAADPGLVRVQDIADVRVIPGTREGTMLRERGLGNAGAHGGPYGDLVVRVRIQGAAPAPEPATQRPEPRASGGEQVIDIHVVEALLGGRITVETPQGSVKLTIPPGTSGNTRMRLKGRGAPGADGTPTDLYVVTRICVPKQLDEESRQLIEAFARLNP